MNYLTYSYLLTPLHTGASSQAGNLMGLVRDCEIVNVSPIEPRPLFHRLDDAQTQAACPSVAYRAVNLSHYFWPLERSRIISAWQRGDFQEARLWLNAHRTQRKSLYELTEYLALATNWEIEAALKGLRNWVVTKSAKQIIPIDQQAHIQHHIHQLCATGQIPVRSKFLKIWESTFLIWLELKRERSSMAFIYFSQTLERLLFLRYRTEDWISLGYITLPEDKKSWGTNYKATFGDLRMAWQKMNGLDERALIMQQFKQINELRNSAVHKGEPLTLTDLKSKLFSGLSSSDVAVDANAVCEAMHELLREVCHPDWQIPEPSGLRLLYQWGLDSLIRESDAL
ncbi:MAG: hypothetical protein IGS50_17505 [Synechococcales cyanobacterium C42_A2020_086]|jgi:hypothetical protein|nr:hypothetical protein [Synechococcales cyanobacterium C42_A2020_086]